MNLYPALQFEMGSWRYYVVKMSTRELAENVKFAYEVYEDRTLDDAIQRVLNETRVKKELVTYLKRQPDRFFSSVVVAALDGNPKFYPVHIADDDRFEVFADDDRLNESFGVLRFDGTQQYYALDGQHRLSSIKTLLDKNNPLSDGAPPGFGKEEMSVVVVVPSADDSDDTFLKKYRRLFSNLNRYAKPTDQVTNIIMDEDDAFAILTRRLVMEHPFFQSAGRDETSRRVKTTKGKNLNETDTYFTSLETLYDLNVRLLSSRERQNSGWGSEDGGQDLATFKRFRPNDEVLDGLYRELVMYWDGLLEELPVLHYDPPNMRLHSIDTDEETPDRTDHLLFWPIGQDLLAELARDLLDYRLSDPDNPTQDDIKSALKGLGQLEWRLHHPPWKFFMLTYDVARSKWKMRSEDRKASMRIALRIQRWVIGEDDLSEDDTDELHLLWQSRLIPAQPPELDQEMWSEVEARRNGILV